MDDFKARYQEFLTHDYQPKKEQYAKLKDAQHPHTLFITCSDSRVVPERLLNANPGEIFEMRNIGNIVPEMSRVDKGYGLATMAAIEFAVKELQVKYIIVCGHSNCGGCKNALTPTEALDTMPSVKNWLAQLMPLSIQVKMEKQNDSLGKQEEALEKLNVKTQYYHLLNIPVVAESIGNGELSVHGWYYEVGNGNLSAYDQDEDAFLAL